MGNTGMIRHGVAHIYRRSTSVIENRERDSSRSDKEHHVKKWEIYPDVGLVVYKSVCPRM
jgi:hypothetical protein